ncbi:hypothetical protein NP233_g5191 [Leucocoprinus birnbaumii]|uniref:Integrase catalytic domain-containing protein n=1 Tax=Leucocoprinus birnbaumii TaxID=56174 RepID=A0AAD5YS44_9AGAR|nr:hypothetical protein NP233_g5191 [Leucocoprinus birnbaumii]
MGPARDSSSTVWSFPKLNGTNYYTWSENMKAALEARGLWYSHIEVEAPPPPKPSIHPPGKKSVDPKTPKKATQGSTIPETPVKPRARFDVDNADDGPDDGNTSSMMASLGLGDEAADEDDAYMYTAVYTQWEKRWEKYNSWKVNDSAAMGWMKGALEPTQWPHVTAAKTAKEMWNLLYELYFVSRKGTQLHFHIWELWHQTWDESTTTMTQFIGKMLELRQRILDCGEDIGDRMLIQAIFMALPHTTDWRILRASMFRRGSELTLNEVITELNAEYDRVQQDKTVDEKGKKAAGELALVASGSGSQKGGNGGGKKSEKKPAKRSKPRPDDECFDCGAKGVWRGHPECSNPKRKGGGSKPQSGGAANIAVDGLKSLGDREVGKVLMAVEGDELGDGLILDCGATSHMFSKKEFFASMIPEASGEYVTVGGHNRVSVAGRGSVRFRARLEKGYLTVTLTDVLYVPKLGHNLVSLGALHKAGASVMSTENGLIVIHGGEELFRATLGGVGGALYMIEHVGQQQERALVASSGSMRLWHRRMGHLSPSAIRAMSNQNMVKDLKLDAPLDYDHLCDGCMHGKSHKLPLPHASASMYSKMELLVMDLTGPMSVPTWDGELYALVVLEVSCRYPVGRLLKSKEEVGGAVRDIVALLERQSGRKAMRLRSDNGTEFVNATMEAFCRRNGIIHETTNPYLPEQNGMAERALAIYFEMVRCMLHSANLDLRYWAVFGESSHLKRGRVASRASNTFAFSVRRDGHTFRQQVRKGGKLSSRAVQVMMVGWWNDETKGYRLEDVEGGRGKIIASRDVRFVEDESPSNLATVDVRGVEASAEQVDELVDNALVRDSAPTAMSRSQPLTRSSPVTRNDEAPQVRPEKTTPLTPPPTTPTEDESVYLTPTTTPSLQDSIAKVHPTENTTDGVDVPAGRSSKWALLPARETSNRIRKPVERYGFIAHGDEVLEVGKCFIANVSTLEEPRTYKDVLQSPFREEWEMSIEKEYKGLEKAKVFKWVDEIPEGRRLVGGRFVFKNKLDAHGALAKRKTRIVAQGFSQVPGEDFNETFASVPKFTTLRVFVTLAAYLNWEIHQVDVVAAFLNGDLEEEIYMRVPEGLEKFAEGRGRYWKLEKSLYGLKQSGRQWKKKLNEVLESLGFVRAVADDSLYILRDKDRIIILVLVWVDDMVIGGPKNSKIDEFKAQIKRHFDITDLGEVNYVLGLQVIRDRANGLIYLSQETYIKSVLERFGMANAHPVSTPLPVGIMLSASQSPQTERERHEYQEYAKGIHYLALVGSLLYATQTRPEIQYAVGLISQFGGNPGIEHLRAAKHILRYLRGTANFALVLGRRGHGAVDLVGWTDSNWAQDPDNRRSIGGFVFEVSGSSVAWSSKKQPTVATSSVEAEYMAASNATKEAIWLRTLLKEIDYPQVDATIIHADNQGCIALAHNPVNHSIYHNHSIHSKTLLLSSLMLRFPRD